MTCYPFQRVRIVHSPFRQMVGLECVLIERELVVWDGAYMPGWGTNLRHPITGKGYGVFEWQVEPVLLVPERELERVAA